MEHESRPEMTGQALGSAAGSQQLSPKALARRRALVKGLGKGGTAIAATVPFSSFAVVVPFGMVEGACTVSGAMSAVSSHTARHQQCVTFTPEALKNPGTWPARLDAQTLTFAALFSGYTTDPTLVKDILAGTAGGDTNRRYWVAANFNARLRGTKSVTFFYTLQQVLDFYSGPKSSDFLAFLKKLWG